MGSNPRGLRGFFKGKFQSWIKDICSEAYLVKDVVQAVLESNRVGCVFRCPASGLELVRMGKGQASDLLARAAQPVGMFWGNLEENKTDL